MTNQSYCRFQNTATDLLDCHEALCGDDPIGLDEQAYARELILICEEIIELKHTYEIYGE